MRYTALFLLLSVLISGCLPTSCEREEHRALFPADSLSRDVARQQPADTLDLVWQSGPRLGDISFQYPRTALFGQDGRLYVSDAEGNRIVTLQGDGELLEVIESENLNYPYLTGLRQDTLLVFNPATYHIDFFVDGESVHRISTPAGENLPEVQRLIYAAADEDHVFFKAIGEDFDNYVARLGRDGSLLYRVSLPGPYWRHAGMMRPWGDSLLSLSFYRPVVDVMPRALSALSAHVDTMALVGFDSPMLGRSRAFVEGDISQPPMMAMSAAPAGDHLFVLNARPGWVHVDVFDREGMLVRSLTEADIWPRRNFYPLDLAVRQRADGAFDIAIVLVEPDPHVRLYRWQPQR